MVGSGIKKFAAENGLSVKEGVAYGNYHVDMLTMLEGSGWKALAYAIKADATQRAVIIEYLSRADVKKEYSIIASEGEENFVLVKVQDTIGTMKVYTALAETLVAFLGAQTIPGSGICMHCGMEGATVPVLTPDGIVIPMHSACADTLNNTIAEQKEAANEKSNGVLIGAVGAICGGILGAIPWAIASYLGWFFSAIGLLIGFLAGKGYDILRGKQCKAKAVIVTVVVIVCVILAELTSSVLVVQSVFKDEGAYLTIGESIEAFGFFMQDSEFNSAIVGNIGMGIVFAALGAWGTVADIFKANGKSATYRKLD